MHSKVLLDVLRENLGPISIREAAERFQESFVKRGLRIFSEIDIERFEELIRKCGDSGEVIVDPVLNTVILSPEWRDSWGS